MKKGVTASLRRLFLRAVIVLAVFWGGGIALFSVLPVPFSAVMAERQISAWLHGDFGYVAHSDWVSMDEISPWMGLAVIAAEDQKFPQHWGFDVSAIEKALAHNAAAVVLAHNHPSGVAEPSSADSQLTRELKQALALIDVRVLDHFIVAGTASPLSFAERGLL